MNIFKLENDITSEVGVIIGRFHVDDLHKGHIDLIQRVSDRHQRVLILIGTTSVMSTKCNPLDFISRERMIKHRFPNVICMPIQDVPHSDELWSANVDIAVRSVFARGSVLLYGSRDSFIKYYTGRFDCVELAEIYTATGTSIRDKIGSGVYDDSSFRAGCIHSFYNQYDSAFACVDVAIINTNNEILLGRKVGRDGYCFIGGFVDPTDDNYEHTARREVYEETGIEITGLEYITNAKINDKRYQSENNKIFSTLFLAKYSFGKPTPNDDMHELKWFDISTLKSSIFIEAHRLFYDKLQMYLSSQIVYENPYRNISMEDNSGYDPTPTWNITFSDTLEMSGLPGIPCVHDDVSPLVIT